NHRRRQPALQPDPDSRRRSLQPQRHALPGRRPTAPRRMLRPLHRSQNAEGVQEVEHPQIMNDLLQRSIPALIANPQRFVTAPAIVERLSKDFYWYSPVLKKQLEHKRAEAVVQPVNLEEIRSILRFCYAHDIPVTPRGAGTGNYGQAIPLHGGLVLDLSRMDAIESIREDGVAVCEPGVRLGVLETEARIRGW